MHKQMFVKLVTGDLSAQPHAWCKALCPFGLIVLLHMPYEVPLLSHPSLDTSTQHQTLHLKIVLLDKIVGEPGGGTVTTSARGP